MVSSHWRGHKIKWVNGVWLYSDTLEPVKNNPDRACGFCGLPATQEGHDGCLGTIPRVMNACCGHGVDSDAYVQFFDKPSIRGEKALRFIARNGFAKTG